MKRREINQSEHFVTDQNGQVVIPGGYHPQPVSDYTVWNKLVLDKQAEVKSSDILYVIKENEPNQRVDLTR